MQVMQVVKKRICTLNSNSLQLGQNTGKSVSEALILESGNPQYDDRLFIDLQVLYKKNTNSEHVVYKHLSSPSADSKFVLNVKTKTKNNFCTQHVTTELVVNFSCTELLIQ